MGCVPRYMLLDTSVSNILIFIPLIDLWKIGGAGALMSMQDAVALANWINVLPSHSLTDLENIFKEYRAERLPVAKQTFETSQMLGKVTATVGASFRMRFLLVCFPCAPENNSFDSDISGSTSTEYEGEDDKIRYAASAGLALEDNADQDGRRSTTNLVFALGRGQWVAQA